MPTKTWHYTVSRTQFGPVSEEEIIQMLRNGRLKGDALVWTEGQADWVPLATIAAFAPHIPASASTPPSLPPALPGAPDYGRPTPCPPSMGNSRAQIVNGHAAIYAGFWKRFAASFLDGTILSIIGFVVGFVIALATGGADEAAPGIMLLNMIFGWLYCAIQESSPTQATIGKRALGIAVVDAASGRPVGFGQASGRYFGKILSCIIFGIGFLMAGFTERKQALHDMMSGCLVVNR